MGNGIALDQENLTEGPSIYTDIRAGILPPILDLPKAKDSLAWVKMGSEMVEIALARGYFTTNTKGSTTEQYDGVTSITEGEAKLQKV